VSTVPPIRRENLVDADPATAFGIHRAYRPMVAAGGAERLRTGASVEFSLLPEPFIPGRPAPMPEEPPRVACTAIMRAAAASSKLR
jgi:hypothetical protein